ncbi:MAG: hypothetical protein ACYTFA_03860 [Planctomycetota bacterium]
MLEDLDAQFEEAKRKLTESDQLKRRLPAERESLTKEVHRLRSLEYELEQATDEVRTLESLTLASLMESLMGRKERTLAEKREGVAKLQQQYDGCVDIVAELDGGVQEIEHQLEQLGNADEVYQALCEEKQRLIIEEGYDAEGRLNGLAEELSHARAELHKVKTAIQTGEHLLERLHSMTRATGRVRSKTFAALGVNVITAAATSAIASQGARGSVNRAGEGLERFDRILSELDLTGGTPTDLALANLGPVISASCPELSLGGAVSGSGAAAPFLDVVQEAVGHLREKSKEMQQQIRQIDEERRTLIESM